MKLKFAIAFLSFALAIIPRLSFAGEAATVVSADTITSDATWSGRVVVERQLKVAKGAKLTVRPGTEVRFKKGAGLTVEGVLKAAGKKGRAITFTSDEKAASPGDWTGISLTEAGDASALRYCTIEYAGTGIGMAVCSTPIQNCEIRRGGTGIVLARKARPKVEAVVIRDMREGGVNCEMGSAPTLSGNTIERCGPFGVTSSQDSQPAIRGNTVSGCDMGMGLSRGVPPVENNTLRDNRAGIILSSAGAGIMIRGNRMAGNDTGIVCQQFSDPVIEKNEITGNRKEGIVCFRASSPIIRNNNISKNVQGVVCVQLCNPRITANNIFENKKAIYLDLSSYAVITGNNIYDNGSQLELGNMSSDWEYKVRQKPSRGGQAQNAALASRGKAVYQDVPDGSQIMGFVDARGNWWGAAVTAEMDAKGPEANIKSFTDYYDVPTRTYEGYSGIYIQDRIRYDGWKKARIKEAGM